MYDYYEAVRMTQVVCACHHVAGAHDKATGLCTMDRNVCGCIGFIPCKVAPKLPYPELPWNPPGGHTC